tara:strand:- start:835 stop:1332 length:498 start_codon:yes stop_codon:yes gene_type:complete
MDTINTSDVLIKRTGENPVSGEGDCIEKNTQRITDFWFKFPEQKDVFNLKVLQIRRQDGIIIHHCLIHNNKNNKLIDVSNGKIKMIDKDLYYESNKPLLEYTFSYNDYMRVLQELKIPTIDKSLFPVLLKQIAQFMFVDMKHSNSKRPRKNTYANKLKLMINFVN